MNKKLLLSISAATILVFVTLSGCNGNKIKTPANVDKPKIQKQLPSSKPKSQTAKPNIELKYLEAVLPSNTKIKQNTPWETSPMGKYEATIEGRGKKAKEEGYSTIFIKDKKSKKLIKLTLFNENKIKLTTKDIEWINEGNMFVILGQPFGMVSMGGKIYKVNIKSGEVSLYLSTKSDREEFTAIHKTSKGFSFEKYVYDDDNYTEGHIVRGTLK